MEDESRKLPDDEVNARLRNIHLADEHKPSLWTLTIVESLRWGLLILGVYILCRFFWDATLNAWEHVKAFILGSEPPPAP